MSVPSGTTTDTGLEPPPTTRPLGPLVRVAPCAQPSDTGAPRTVTLALRTMIVTRSVTTVPSRSLSAAELYGGRVRTPGDAVLAQGVQRLVSCRDREPTRSRHGAADDD